MRDEGIRQFRRGGTNEARPVALACVGGKGELRDNQHAAADINDGTVHLAILVLENPEFRGLAGQPFGFGLPVALDSADQRQQTGADFSNRLAVSIFQMRLRRHFD